jgi:2-polyprenyl-3-methyl-5-hydroxy-6-metoxy-1,4-benzoquinol methylase
VKLDAVPENLLERVVLAARLAPRPILHTILAFGVARAIMVATKLGVFEVLAQGAKGADEVAAALGADSRATEKLLNSLLAQGYVRFRNGRYSLGRDARKWLVADSPQSLRDSMLGLEVLEWEAMERLEEFVRTGRPLHIHEEMTDAEWQLYQREMRSIAALTADEVGQRIPVPDGARDMLDIGGSHGYLSVVICRRHPGLRSTVLDLPQAVEHARPILEREGMGDRVVQRAGNALTDELGENAYDLVLIANVVHHFDEEQNRELARRVARALRPGGFYVISDLIGPSRPGEGGQIGAFMDLFFALTSEAGTWSFDELAAWQRDAGLEPQKPIRLRKGPGIGMQAGRKP